MKNLHKAVFVCALMLMPVLAQGAFAEGVLDLVPAEAKGVAFFDVKKFVTTDFFAFIKENAPDDPEGRAAEVMKQTGIDVKKDIFEIVVFTTDPSKRKEVFGGVVNGSFNRAKLKERGIALKMTPSEKYMGYQILKHHVKKSVPKPKRARPSRKNAKCGKFPIEIEFDVYIAFLDKNTIAFGDLESLKGIIAVKEGKAKPISSNAEMKKLMDLRSDSAVFWTVGNVVPEKRSERIAKSGRKVNEAFAAVEKFVFSADEDATNLNMSLVLVTKSSAAASNIAKIMNQRLALGKAKAKLYEKALPGVKKNMEGVSIKSEGEKVNVGFAMEKSFLKEVFKYLEAMKKKAKNK